MTRLVVLVSGAGTNLQALLDAAEIDPRFPRTVAVGADRPDAAALGRAARQGIPTFVVRPAEHPDRPAWDAALAGSVASHRPDLVVCAGFMRILGPAFLARFMPRIVNTHPALLPAFPGKHAVREALVYGAKVTGATVHLVDAGVDSGPVVAQVCVPVAPGDDEASLHERIKVAERALLVDAVRSLAGGFSVEGRSVRFP
ncbi:MAG TPA: phosphoribosylglycinamide formyltransferase [Mycobacteriales bacterium]|nr:phosphoribosylglycinamide formyltransferase [Mycobacteriales bacterium]